MELESIVEQKRKNKPGAGRKKLKINEEVYPLLKLAMEKAARCGGDTTRKVQAANYIKKLQ